MKGWMLVGGFFVDAWLLGIALQRMAYGCLVVGIRARAALTTAVARKVRVARAWRACALGAGVTVLCTGCTAQLSPSQPG
jgi:hypothetical protein